LAPFEPDIVGEHLACRILSECFGTTNERQKLIDAAWTAAPEEFEFFLYRLEQDGLHADGTGYSTAVDQLFQMPGQQCGRPALLGYCELLWCSMHLLPLDRRQKNVEQLQAIYDDSGGDIAIELELVKELAELAISVMRIDEPRFSFSDSVRRIDEPRFSFSENARIAIELTRGLFNLTDRQQSEVD
jgi:hypothetical protein